MAAGRKLRRFALLDGDRIIDIQGDHVLEEPDGDHRSVWDDPAYVAAHEATLDELRACHTLEDEAKAERLAVTRAEHTVALETADEDARDALTAEYERRFSEIENAHEGAKSRLAGEITQYETILEKVRTSPAGTVVRFEEGFHADFRAKCVEITDHDPEPQVGWSRGKGGKFAPPEPYRPTSEQRSAAAIAAGFEVDGALYHAGGSIWERMKDEALHAHIFGEFRGGKQLTWPAISGEVTFKDIDKFKATYRTLGEHLAAWHRYADGKGDEPK